MSKKNRNKHKHHSVLSSLKDLGNKPRETLSRLATTVKTDAPTLLVDKGQGKGPAPKRDLQPTRLSRMAQNLNPFSPQRRAKQKMAKLQKQMAASHATPVRRSRLPIVYAVLAMLCLAGGGWIYSSISLPEVNVAQYLDYQKWLEIVSGRRRVDGEDKSANVASTSAKREESKEAKAQARKDRLKPSVITSPNAVGKLDEQLVKQAAAATKTGSKAKGAVKTAKSGKATGAKLAKGKSSKAKGAKGAKPAGFAKLSKAEKEKVWKAKLAKLRKQSDSKYKKTSFQKK